GRRALRADSFFNDARSTLNRPVVARFPIRALATRKPKRRTAQDAAWQDAPHPAGSAAAPAAAVRSDHVLVPRGRRNEIARALLARPGLWTLPRLRTTAQAGLQNANGRACGCLQPLGSRRHDPSAAHAPRSTAPTSPATKFFSREHHRLRSGS